MVERRPRPNLSVGDRLEAAPHNVRAHVPLLARRDERTDAPAPDRTGAMPIRSDPQRGAPHDVCAQGRSNYRDWGMTDALLFDLVE